MKETQESKAWGCNNDYHGVKVSAEYIRGHASSKISYNDLDKVVYMRENLSVASSITSSSPLTYRVKTSNEQPSFHSSSFNADNVRQTFGSGGSICSSEKTSGGSQADLVRGPCGHVSMADIVMMGRPHTWGSYMAEETSNTPENMDARDSLCCCLKPSHDSSPSPGPLEMHQDLQFTHPANVSDAFHQSGTTSSQHNYDDEWLVIKQQAAVSRSSILNSSTTSGMGIVPNQSHLFDDGIKLPKNCQSEVKVSERNVASKNLDSNCVEFDSSSIGQENTNRVGGASDFNDCSFKDIISYDSHKSMNELLHEGRESCAHLSFASGSVPLNDKVSSTVAILHQLSLEKEAKLVPLLEDDCPVVFPNDMQTLAAECPHLTFVTYNSGVHANISGPLASNPSKTNLKEVSAVIDGSSSVGLETRHEYRLYYTFYHGSQYFDFFCAEIQLTSDGDFILKDADGTIAWSTNTAGKSVAGLNLTDMGNLVLFYHNNATVWQSFDHPTDSLVPGQKLMAGQKLIPSISATNWTQLNLLSYSVTDEGAVASIESSPPQVYDEFTISGRKTNREPTYVTLQNGSFALFANSSQPSAPDLFQSIPEASSVQYVRFCPDGHLRLYEWTIDGWKQVADLLSGRANECFYPTVCGNYGICSNGQCSCPSTTYFKQINDRQPDLGFLKLLPCLVKLLYITVL
ncbi:hypothetical protein GH714_014900 [Hevea brasiliensis]|uniref:Bulb-type lectin domain-containing protein n=1 Tax=Hevea brasiliensis TaxID=3981 RepID=A0A6A6KRT0_HEVBR|nr:hypothetical protein GH714_014900 [Hevea brasiliensis]